MKDCSKKQERNDRYVGNFKMRGERRATKGDDKRTSIERCEGNERRAEVRRLPCFERFICVRENLVLESLIYLVPEERFKNRSNVTKFRSFGDSTSSNSGVAGILSRRELQ